MKKRKLALITLLAVVSMMSIGINAYAENTDSSISQEASDSEASATESVSDAPMQVQLILKDNKNFKCSNTVNISKEGECTFEINDVDVNKNDFNSIALALESSSSLGDVVEEMKFSVKDFKITNSNDEDIDITVDEDFSYTKDDDTEETGFTLFNGDSDGYDKVFGDDSDSSSSSNLKGLKITIDVTKIALAGQKDATQTAVAESSSSSETSSETEKSETTTTTTETTTNNDISNTPPTGDNGVGAIATLLGTALTFTIITKKNNK